MTALPLQGADGLPTVLVLASGRGQRFLASGGTTHKLQADLCGKTVLERTLDAVRASGLHWHLEDAGHPGMGDSIAAAVRATGGAAGWLVLPADLPLIRPSTLQALARPPVQVEVGVDVDVWVPVFMGRRGHPVRFSAACGAALAHLRGEAGASALLKTLRVATLPVDDPGSVQDIDTLADLQAAAAMWQFVPRW